MLHAITHNKSRLHLRFLGHRYPHEKRVQEEDEITALIMGPLAFLPASAIGMFWMALIRLNNPEKMIDFPDGPVTHAEMHFWPRKNKIEPDLLVDLSWEGERRLLLIEFKWGASLSGPDQLHKQWLVYLTDEERQRAWHLFIARDTSEASNALSRGNVWENRLLLRSWFDVLNTLYHLNGRDADLLTRWSNEVIGCLSKLRIRPFRGFQNFAAPIVLSQKEIVFWRGFDGFADLEVPEGYLKNGSQQGLLFFTGGHCG